MTETSVVEVPADETVTDDGSGKPRFFHLYCCIAAEVAYCGYKPKALKAHTYTFGVYTPLDCTMCIHEAEEWFDAPEDAGVHHPSCRLS